MKLVLFNLSVEKDSTLLGSFNGDCLLRNVNDFPTVDDLLANIENENISHIACVYHFDGLTQVPFYKVGMIGSRGNYENLTPSMVKLFTTLKEKNGNLIVDLLSCNLNKNEFKEEMLKVESDLGITIRYSTNPSGNRPLGDWILESHNIDVKDLYFTENINNWNGILTGALNDNLQVPVITYNQIPLTTTDPLTGQTVNVVDPVTNQPIMVDDLANPISNPPTLPRLENLTEGTTPTTFITKSLNTPTTGKTTYTLTRNITWSLITGNNAPSTNYIKLEANEIFNGNGYTIDLGNVINQVSGIFLTGGTNASNCSEIKNLGVLGGSTIGGQLGTGTGAIVNNQCLSYKIDRCYSTIQVQANGGGIAGCHGGTSAFNNAYYEITNCYHGVNGGYNDIFPGGGGIISVVYGDLRYAEANPSDPDYANLVNIYAHSYPTLIVNNCYHFGGNIYGFNPVDFGNNDETGEQTLNSSGVGGGLGYINAAGGIVGVGAGYFSNYTIENCFSTGTIGRHAGGITGPYAAYSRGKVAITNCYSASPTIANCGGGIVGSRSGWFGHAMGSNNPGTGPKKPDGSSSYLLIENCYSVGILNKQPNLPVVSPGYAGGIMGYKTKYANVYNSYCNGKAIGEISSTGEIWTNLNPTGSSIQNTVSIWRNGNYTYTDLTATPPAAVTVNSWTQPNMSLTNFEFKSSTDIGSNQIEGSFNISENYTRTGTSPNFSYTTSGTYFSKNIGKWNFTATTGIWSGGIVLTGSEAAYIRSLSDKYPKLNLIQQWKPTYLIYDLRPFTFQNNSNINYTNPNAATSTPAQNDTYINNKRHEYLAGVFSFKPDLTTYRATKESLGIDQLSYRPAIGIISDEYIVVKPNYQTPVEVPQDGTGVYCALENGDSVIYGLPRVSRGVKNLKIERIAGVGGLPDTYRGQYTDIWDGTNFLFSNKLDKEFYYLMSESQQLLYTFVFGGGEATDGNNPCLHENTEILTPQGYVNIKNLTVGDSVLTSENKLVRIRKISKVLSNGNIDERNYLVLIPANSIAENYPPKDCLISQFHSIKLGDKWVMPYKNLHIFNKDTVNAVNMVYNIELENFHTDHLVINGGLVVESLGNKNNKEHGIDWTNRYNNSLIL